MTVPVPVTDQLAGAEILAYLGLDPDTVEAQAAVRVARRYQLDPLLNHLGIYRGKVYITRDGMLEIAHRSGVLDGIVVEEQRESENGYSATVTVWRKDMSHPFTYKGGCGIDETNAQQGHGPEMALARAERRALRRAFSIPAYDDADEPIIEPEEPAEHRTIGPSRRDGILVCACGKRFGTAWEMSAHKKQPEIPGPAPAAPPEPPRAHPPRPAGPGAVQRNPRRLARPVETGPPVDYYDNLPEARGYK